jgi:single-strand DNA-binding protein
MSLQLNEVRIAGNLTRDPELRFLANERCVANFGLAVNRRWKDPNTQETKEEVTFLDIEAWGRTAELIGKYLSKGSGCYVAGRLKQESWQDKDGKNRSRLKIVADDVKFTTERRDGPTGDGKTSSPEPKPAPRPAGTTATDDEPPF